MSYIQLLCQNGCYDSSYEPVLKLAVNLLEYVRILVPAVLIIVALLLFFIWLLSNSKKDKKLANYKKVSITLLLLALAIFVITTIIIFILNGVMPPRDEALNCWCK